MKFDYSKSFEMMKSIPNLTPIFAKLPNNLTKRKNIADRFGFFFFLTCGTLLMINVVNANHHSLSNDFSHGFKVLPDYITGTVLVSYRKERKQFILY